MSCKEYQHPITLLLYEELPEAARTALETHIHECAYCNDAYESEKSIHSVLVDDAARWEIPPDFLVESRKALADELDRIEKKRSRWRIPTFSVSPPRDLRNLIPDCLVSISRKRNPLKKPING
jgi:hypothetical protein